MPNLIHARFWHDDGNSPNGHDCLRHDPHNFGVELISAMAYAGEHEKEVMGVSLDGVIVNHHKGDDFGHQVHVAATKEQWEAVRNYWLENYRLNN